MKAQAYVEEQQQCCDEMVENNTGESKDEASEVSDYELGYHAIPARPTFKQENDSTRYHPHPHTHTQSDSLKRERLHHSFQIPQSYSHQTQSHHTRQTSSIYHLSHSHTGATPRTNDPSSSSTADLRGRSLICCVNGLDRNHPNKQREYGQFIYDAAAGVNMVWQRLEDCYGSTEAIENALLKKVDEFPRISNRENQRLRELGDLLLKLEAARVDGFLPGLNYLGSSRGITQIAQKLPYSLQDKWVSVASHFKEKCRTTYPPFSFFALNDPSFASLEEVEQSFKSDCANIYRSNVYPHQREAGYTIASPPKDLFEEEDSLGKGVQQTPDDDQPAMSVEDQAFLDIMDREVFMDDSNSWVAPLPFRQPRCRLPSNRTQAVKCLAMLRRMLEKKPDMKEHMVAFKQKIFEAGQVRAVFDSSAKHDGVSLNDVLLTGPDLNNTLLGVLTHFRKEPVAVVTDIEQMLYCFKVCQEHCDFLRFLWFEDNDLTKEITEYRMTVHVFDNSPSPTVAIYGLRRAAMQGHKEYGTEAKQFVLRKFYVYDGLNSFSTDDDAIQVLQKTKEMELVEL
ncbi:hypothetical protein JOB18_010271 [Solea senegalensis]|uniref:Uncharacterized protein n=1 Tax=Solea senegalensis TaxID=28829 RepID=A0AAV6PQ02_SOLSE|nr:hypothetical protein JOB18_010271 [Solea senegalensis]